MKKIIDIIKNIIFVITNLLLLCCALIVLVFLFLGFKAGDYSDSFLFILIFLFLLAPVIVFIKTFYEKNITDKVKRKKLLIIIVIEIIMILFIWLIITPSRCIGCGRINKDWDPIESNK